MVDFSYNKKTCRFHYSDTKRFVPQTAVSALVDKAIAQKQSEASELTAKLLNKQIPVSEWEAAVAKLIKTATLQLSALGKPNMSQKDFGLVGSQLKFQYSKLRRFSHEILSGKLSEAQIQARVALYFSKNRGAFERSRLEANKEAGAVWEKRIRPAKESCTSCIEYESLGWQTIGFLPSPTEKCECRSNCKCYKTFSWSKTKPQESLSFVTNIDSCSILKDFKL